METNPKNSKNTDNQDFAKEYHELIDASETTVVIQAEWVKEGDNFKKLTIYDNNYTPVPTLGDTTLINTL